MESLTIPKGDKGFNLEFTIQDSSGSAYTLTDYTIKLKVWKEGTSGGLFVNGSCDIDVAANGTCHYTVVTGDFDKVGDYLAELELTKTDVIESTETFEIKVVESG